MKQDFAHSILPLQNSFLWETPLSVLAEWGLLRKKPQRQSLRGEGSCLGHKRTGKNRKGAMQEEVGRVSGEMSVLSLLRSAEYEDIRAFHF